MERRQLRSLEGAWLVANARDLRRIAKSLEGTLEAPHFDRVAFKVARIYATLAPDGLTANLMLAPDEQQLKCLVAPEAFNPVPNAWGKRGATTVTLSKLRVGELRNALEMAWRRALLAKRPEVREHENHLERAFELMRATALELDLPGLEESTWLGRPSLRVRGRSIIGCKDGKSLVVRCPIEEKGLLLEAAPEIYFETGHYKGHPAVLMRPEHVNKDDLKQRIERAWRLHAPKRFVAEHDARMRAPRRARRERSAAQKSCPPKVR